MSTTLQCVVLKAPAGVEDSSPKLLIRVAVATIGKCLLISRSYLHDPQNQRSIRQRVSVSFNKAKRPDGAAGTERAVNPKAKGAAGTGSALMKIGKDYPTAIAGDRSAFVLGR